jgi:hypothetical protein
MPTLAASRAASLDNYKPVQPTPARPPLTPLLPADLNVSSVMISSLPGIATNVDGITRQFNGRGTVPTRRLITPQ